MLNPKNLSWLLNKAYKNLPNRKRNLLFIAGFCLLLCTLPFRMTFAQDAAPSHTIYLPQIMTGLETVKATPTPAFGENQPPILKPLNDRTNTVGNRINMWLSAEDPDGDSLTYSATDLPPGLTIDNNSGQIYGVMETIGSYAVIVRAIDSSGGAGIASFLWSVSENQPTNPSINITPLSDQLSKKDDSVFLTFSVTSASQETLSFSATGLPTGLSIILLRITDWIVDR